MSKLIQLRQRIKVIETIKKITHAMRLISMSKHSHLKSLQEPIDSYNSQFNALFAQLLSAAPLWQNKIINPSLDDTAKTLLIIIGSQKGLCGGFNTHLFKLVSHHLDKQNYPSDQLDIIAIGQKAVDFTFALKQYTVKHSYEKSNTQHMESIAQEITHTIIHAQPSYHTVLVASNIFKSFFLQKPHIKKIIPFIPDTSSSQNFDDFMWEQTPQEMLDTLVAQYLSSDLSYFIFQSLFAEYAARFISMDGAMRNAESLLDAAKLEYNKVRQTKITKELTELVSSL